MVYSSAWSAPVAGPKGPERFLNHGSLLGPGDVRENGASDRYLSTISLSIVAIGK